jgi:hypothetical protein
VTLLARRPPNATWKVAIIFVCCEQFYCAPSVERPSKPRKDKLVVFEKNRRKTPIFEKLWAWHFFCCYDDRYVSRTMRNCFKTARSRPSVVGFRHGSKFPVGIGETYLMDIKICIEGRGKIFWSYFEKYIWLIGLDFFLL